MKWVNYSGKYLSSQQHVQHYPRGHSFNTYAKFSKKLTFLTPSIRLRTCAYQGVRNVNCSEKFSAYVLNEWSPNEILCSIIFLFHIVMSQQVCKHARLMRVAFPRDYKFFIYWNLVPKITIDLIQMSAIYNFMTFSDSSGWDYY